MVYNLIIIHLCLILIMLIKVLHVHVARSKKLIRLRKLKNKYFRILIRGYSLGERLWKFRNKMR